MAAVPLPMPGVGAGWQQPVHQFGPRGDCTHCSWYTDPDPDFAATGRWEAGICSGPNSDDAYAACARAESPILEGGCTNCSIVCPSRRDVSAWIADVGDTLLFDDIHLDQSAFNPDDWPRFIPQTDGSPATKIHDVHPVPAWAVGLRRIFSPDSWSIMPKWEGEGVAREAMGLPDGVKTVAQMYATDPLVERFYSLRKRDGLIEKMVRPGFDLVLPPNASCYGNWPRSFLTLNYRRNMILAQEFSDAGQLTAPNLYWFRMEDLVRYERWALDTEPRVLAVNLQTFRTRSDWESFMLPGLTWMSMAMPEDVRWVFTTGGNIARIRLLHDLFGDRMILISQKPWQTSQHGEALNSEGKWEVVQARPADAFSQTMERLEGWLTGKRPWPAWTAAEDAASTD
jgi:hypothetical protein